MIPIRDANPGVYRPVITWLLVAASTFVFFFVQPHAPQQEVEFTLHYAAIPCEITTGQPLDRGDTKACSERPVPPPFFPRKDLAASVLVSMFLHANIWHLLGNMWVLWIFGNNVEDAFGKLGYLVLYLVSGVVATAGFILANPTATTPLIGASGAIAGMMGAYFVLYPNARVVSIFPILFFIPIALPAWIFLAFWFVGQFFTVAGSPVAWQAHVAGFLFGVIIAGALRPLLLGRVARARRRLAARYR